ncbi:MAG: hypothetical protein J1E33_04350 [Alistipes sp.]|nr:hypothetical protein [Alistipes sp.]
MKQCHKKHNEVCNECEQEFIDEMNRLVGAVENHSRSEYHKKEREIEAAFGQKSKEPAGQR